jgi:hypothetical protein
MTQLMLIVFNAIQNILLILILQRILNSAFLEFKNVFIHKII